MKNKKETAPEVPVKEQPISEHMKGFIRVVNTINPDVRPVLNLKEENISRNIINEFKKEQISIYRATVILKFCIELLKLTKVN